MSPSAAIGNQAADLRAHGAAGASAHQGAREAYPFAIVPTDAGFSAGGLQFPAAVTASTRSALMERLAEVVALYVADALASGATLEPPLAPAALDLGDYTAEGLYPEVVYVRPAAVSDASIAIARALHVDGVSAAELARRMGVARSVISRLTDPLYFGHSTRTLRSVAAALDRTLTIALEPT